MHKSDRLSATHEMYLKIVYQLGQSGDAARVGQMAKGLGVHPSTVSAVVRTLDRLGLVTHDRYGVVKLTDVGERLAECVVRRFDSLKRFFVVGLGMGEDDAEIEACEIEHAISGLAVRRLQELTRNLVRMGYVAPPKLEPSSSDKCGECVLAGECTVARALAHDSAVAG